MDIEMEIIHDLLAFLSVVVSSCFWVIRYLYKPEEKVKNENSSFMDTGKNRILTM